MPDEREPPKPGVLWEDRLPDDVSNAMDEAIKHLRAAIAQETDPPTKAHLTRKLKLMDPELRDAYIKTLGPVVEPK